MQASGASARRRLSPLGGAVKILAVLAVAVGFSLAAERAEAVDARHSVAAKPVKETVVAVKDVEITSSIEAKSRENASCDISRKRLFVEGEGWIVRRVTTCY